MTAKAKGWSERVRAQLFSYLDSNKILIFRSPDKTEMLRIDGTSAQKAVVINDGSADVDGAAEAKALHVRSQAISRRLSWQV